MDAPELHNEKRVIDVNTAPFEEISALPEFIQEKMKKSEEYAARVKHQGERVAESLCLRP